jgi:hypothetical protein
MKIIIAFFVLSMVMACKPKPDLKINQYFNIKGLFEKQISDLAAEKPIFLKQIQINGVSEAKEISNFDWRKELDPFLQTDINKAAYLGSYEIIESDTTTHYILKANQKLPIKRVNIIHGKSFISLIEINSSDNNMLYKWSKILTASFDSGKLQYYTVKSSQKILVFSEEIIAISSKRK